MHVYTSQHVFEQTPRIDTNNKSDSRKPKRLKCSRQVQLKSKTRFPFLVETGFSLLILEVPRGSQKWAHFLTTFMLFLGPILGPQSAPKTVKKGDQKWDHFWELSWTGPGVVFYSFGVARRVAFNFHCKTNGFFMFFVVRGGSGSASKFGSNLVHFWVPFGTSSKSCFFTILCPNSAPFWDLVFNTNRHKNGPNFGTIFTPRFS